MGQNMKIHLFTYYVVYKQCTYLIVDKSSDIKVLLTCHCLLEAWSHSGVDVVVVGVSDDHGYGKPTGLLGMGLVGAGAGNYI